MHTQPLLDGYITSSDSKSLKGTGYSTTKELSPGSYDSSLTSHSLFNSHSPTNSLKIQPLSRQNTDSPIIINFHEEKNNIPFIQLPPKLPELPLIGDTPNRTPPIGNFTPQPDNLTPPTLVEANLTFSSAITTPEQVEVRNNDSHIIDVPDENKYGPHPIYINTSAASVDSKDEPLLNSKEIDKDSACLTEEEKETLAFYIYQNTQDKITPLSGKERYIFGLVVLFGLISAVNCKDFGDKFVRGLKELSVSFNASEELTQTIVSWSITASYFLAQFSLSANSLLTVLTRFTRYCVSPITPTEEQANSVIALLKKFKNYKTRKNFIIDQAEKPLTWAEIIAYIVVIPSVFPSGRFGYEAMHDAYGAPEAAARLGNLRTPAATAVNINFTKNFMEKRRPESDYPIIELYRSAKVYLKNLALNKQQGDAQKFIKLLNEGLLQHLTAPTSAKDGDGRLFQNKMETIIDQLLAFTPAPLCDSNSPGKSHCPTRSDVATYLSILISILVSLTNFKGGTIVPKELGFTMPKDLWEFFAKINDQSTTIVAATLIGAIFFGLPSWFVNTVINATSCKVLFTSLGNLCSDIHAEVKASKKDKNYEGYVGHIKAIPSGLKNYLTPYWGKEGLYVLAAACGGIGYGFGNGGAGYKYPPLDNRPIPIINMSLSTIVYSALGYVSISGLISTLRNGADQGLLQAALDKVKNPTSDDNLETYFNTLADPVPAYQVATAPSLSKKQSDLITLLLQIVEKALDTQIDSFKRLKPEYVEALMPESQQARVKARTDTELKNIVIDDFQTREFKGQIVGSATDSPAVEMEPINTHVPARSRNESPTYGNYAFFLHHPSGNKERIGYDQRRGSAFNSLPSGYDNSRIIPQRFPTDSPIITQQDHVIDIPDFNLNQRPKGGAT